MGEWLYTFARVLLPLLFVVEGVGQLANIATFADMLQRANMPLQIQMEMAGSYRFVVLGGVVASIEVVGGVMIMIGYRTRFAAWLLAAFTLGTIVVGHPFWLMEGSLQAINLTHALKNLSIVAGLLMITVHGPGAYALDNRRRRPVMRSPAASARVPEPRPVPPPGPIQANRVTDRAAFAGSEFRSIPAASPQASFPTDARRVVQEQGKSGSGD